MYVHAIVTIMQAWYIYLYIDIHYVATYLLQPFQ